MFLDEVLALKRRELAVREAARPLTTLYRALGRQPPPLSLARALKGPGLKLVAEVKQASPSRGLIRRDFDPVAIAAAYADGGAAAVSVLTEEHYFKGCLDYLAAIKGALGRRLPLLRKDFIIAPYQVYEARAAGADALLLIVAALTPAQLGVLLMLTAALSMEVLVEVHSEAELRTALAAGASIIGINNRDLSTLKVDIATTERLAPLVPPGKLIVSESGVRNAADLRRVAAAGVQAVLVGEALMGAADIPAKIKELCGQG